MKVESFRDVLILPVSQDNLFILACDSSGGIGEKSQDPFQTSYEVVGYFTARVVLAEILALGAQPITLVDTLAVEMEPAGRKILQGIKKALKEIDLDTEISLNGSTEENFPTVQTGIGITAMGTMTKGEFRKKKAKKGCQIILAGRPLVGPEVLAQPENLLGLGEIPLLQRHPKVLEILPVGSKGVYYEIQQMAKDNHLKFALERDLTFSLEKSAGPATCSILAVEDGGLEELRKLIKSPLEPLGRFLGESL